jgi:hypothetical protein
LRGATEWTNPEHLFSSGVVSVADRAPRTDQQPAPPSGPNPVGCHAPARRSIGATSEGGKAEVPQRIGDLQDIFERTVRAKGASLSRRRPMTRWREWSRTAAKAHHLGPHEGTVTSPGRWSTFMITSCRHW